MKIVTTRFAPSPTGYIHIGNVRSAIYPYLIAKQNPQGTFILRIEDTDRARYVDGATELIEDTLKWLGLNWDEGPKVGGKTGPYFQSKRQEYYHKWAQKLIEQGSAYADDTPAEVIQSYREEANARKIPFLYRNHRPKNSPKWQPGLALRFKTRPKNYTYQDAVMGELKMGAETQDDFILIKADGLPTYNFAHIVDDHMMNVTHVIRGQEYLPSMGNYLSLYEALNLERPIFAHLPHILAATGNKKLSKRDGAKSVTDYRSEGILSEAMLNFLACLGWNDASEKEIYSIEELLVGFKLSQVGRSSARFDEQKLLWLNGQWLRKLFKEKPQELYLRSTDFWSEAAKNSSDEKRYAVFSIVYDRLRSFADIKMMTDYFFVEPKIDLKLISDNKFLKKFSTNELISSLQNSVDALNNAVWQSDKLQDVLNQLLQQNNKKPAELFSLIRIALSFAAFSPALSDTLYVLGKETSLNRLNKVIEALNNQRN